MPETFSLSSSSSNRNYSRKTRDNLNRKEIVEKRSKMAAVTCNESKLEDIHEETKQDNGLAAAAADDDFEGVDEAKKHLQHPRPQNKINEKKQAVNNNQVNCERLKSNQTQSQKQQTPRSQRMTNKSFNERLPSPSTFRNRDYYNYYNLANNLPGGNGGSLAFNSVSKRRQLSGNSRMRQILIQNQRALNEIAQGLVHPYIGPNENVNIKTTRDRERATSTNQTFRSTSNSISSSPSLKLFRSNTQRTSRSVALVRPLNESVLIKCPFKQDQQRARSFTMSMSRTTSTMMPSREPRAGSSNSFSNSRSEFAQRTGACGGLSNRNDSPSSSFLNELNQNRSNQVATVVNNALPTSRTNNSPFNNQQKLNQLPPNPSTELIVRTAKSVNDFVEVYEKSHISALGKPPRSTKKPTFRDRNTSYSGYVSTLIKYLVFFVM